MATPLVSVLIPTRHRPDYLRLAVASAQAQGLQALEIIVSDNGGDELSAQALAPVVQADARIRYLRCPEKDHYLENWLHALAQARGRYVSFLMDDDLYLPDKLSRMVAVMEAMPEVGLVTSHRQLIDEAGRPLPELPGTEHQFASDAVVDGSGWARQMLLLGRNVVGEPTTVLMRREELGAAFGHCLGRQYQVLSDLATWVALMHGRKAAWLHQTLSQFRLHGGQDQRRPLQALRAGFEWLQLLLDADDAGWFEGQDAAVRASLQAKLDGLMPHLTAQAPLLRSQPGEAERIQRLMRQALDRLLH